MLAGADRVRGREGLDIAEIVDVSGHAERLPRPFLLRDVKYGVALLLAVELLDLDPVLADGGGA